MDVGNVEAPLTTTRWGRKGERRFILLINVLYGNATRRWSQSLDRSVMFQVERNRGSQMHENVGLKMSDEEAWNFVLYNEPRGRRIPFRASLLLVSLHDKSPELFATESYCILSTVWLTY